MSHKGTLYADDLHAGNVAEVGYQRPGYPAVVWTSIFLGWELEAGEPRMRFRDLEDGLEWSAYMFKGRMSLGSSADALKVFKVVTTS